MSTETLLQLRAGQLAGATELRLSCGLKEVPPEIFDLADSLEILHLTGNELSDLPDDLPRLKKLRILFCSQNLFRHLPPVLGDCPSLRMVGFKANAIETVAEKSLSPSLRWLILTDNRISHLPASLGNCREMQKLMLSGNLLASLPEEMAQCSQLELLRLAANRFTELPSWLLALPRLAWLAFGGNPCSTLPNLPALPSIEWSQLSIREKLGAGASGDIYKAALTRGDDAAPLPVAVKLFKGAVTSDGLPGQEMIACMAAGVHPHLTETLGRVTGHPDKTEGLVMSLIPSECRNLAGPPSFDSCTRDVYAEGTRFSVAETLQIAKAVASSSAHLHSRGLLHADLYAHNVLWDPLKTCLFGDFGAASFFSQAPPAQAESLQKIEARAFGYLLEELLERCVAEPGDKLAWNALKTLQHQCLTLHIADRPLFSEIQEELERISKI